jgi:hypothetical protein
MPGGSLNNHITIDVDWADDEWIEYVDEKLKYRGCKATWFITHDSDAVRGLFSNKNYEIGIHPNILRCDVTSNGFREPMRDIISLYKSFSQDRTPPRVVRSHKLVQSIDILCDFARCYKLDIDVSDFLPYHENLHPYQFYMGIESKIMRVPYNWQDDFILRDPTRNDFYDVDEIQAGMRNYIRAHTHGLNIFNFHPVHVFFNHGNFTEYEKNKKFKTFEYNDYGTIGHMFDKLTAYVSKNGKTITEIVNESCHNWTN